MRIVARESGRSWLAVAARSRQPGDMSIFACRSANARIAGTHETVGRRNENSFDPYYFSARWACRDQPPDARPDHGGGVAAVRAFEIDHFGRHRPAAHARAPAGAFAAGRRFHEGRLDAAPSFKPDRVVLHNVRSGQGFAAARAARPGATAYRISTPATRSVDPWQHGWSTVAFRPRRPSPQFRRARAPRCRTADCR